MEFRVHCLQAEPAAPAAVYGVGLLCQGDGALARGAPAGRHCLGICFAIIKEVVDDVGVPWLGDEDCCVWEMPRDAGSGELESFFFEDLLASFARDNCSC